MTKFERIRPQIFTPTVSHDVVLFPFREPPRTAADGATPIFRVAVDLRRPSRQSDREGSLLYETVTDVNS